MRDSTFIDKLIQIVSIVSLFYINAAFAAFVPDASTMLNNLTAAIPELMRLVTALAYVMGMFLIIKGVYALKQYGETRSMMSSEHNLKGPLIYIAVGSALLYLPTSVQVGLSSFWKNPSPYAYLDEGATSTWKVFMDDIFMIIQFVGIIAFIRGMIILTHLGGGQGQQGTFGRAISHIIAGVLCINMYQFLQVIFNTLGYGQI